MTWVKNNIIKSSRKLLYLYSLLICSSLATQDFAKWDSDRLILHNEYVIREISTGDKTFQNEVFKLKGEDQNFLLRGSKGFPLDFRRCCF